MFVLPSPEFSGPSETEMLTLLICGPPSLSPAVPFYFLSALTKLTIQDSSEPFLSLIVSRSMISELVTPGHRRHDF